LFARLSGLGGSRAGNFEEQLQLAKRGVRAIGIVTPMPYWMTLFRRFTAHPSSAHVQAHRI
jgi:hypothetical protein